MLILGFTFKGDCPDVRNTKFIEIVKELKDFNMAVDVYDSWAKSAEVKREYGLSLITTLRENCYDGNVLAVDHSEFKNMGVEKIRRLDKETHALSGTCSCHKTPTLDCNKG